MSKKDDVKFHSPIPYHKVIEELSDTIFEKFVNDERSNDSFLETPHFKISLNDLNKIVHCFQKKMR